MAVIRYGVDISRLVRLHHINHAAMRLSAEGLIRLANPKNKAKSHVAQSRNVRVYVGLLKKSDPYRGSKMQANNKKFGKK